MQIAMKSVCMVFEVPFQKLMDAVEQFREDIREGMHALNCSPLYYSSILELSNSEHGHLCLQDM